MLLVLKEMINKITMINLIVAVDKILETLTKFRMIKLKYTKRKTMNKVKNKNKTNPKIDQNMNRKILIINKQIINLESIIINILNNMITNRIAENTKMKHHLIINLINIEMSNISLRKSIKIKKIIQMMITNTQKKQLLIKIKFLLKKRKKIKIIGIINSIIIRITIIIIIIITIIIIIAITRIKKDLIKQIINKIMINMWFMRRNKNKIMMRCLIIKIKMKIILNM